MKKLSIFFLVLAILAFPVYCIAEDISIGSGFIQNSGTQQDSGSINAGIGGGLSNSAPASSAVPSVPERPSPEWLAGIDAAQIADICALLNDSTYISIADIPERLLEQFNPASEYGPEPALLIYAPSRVPAMFKLVMSANPSMSVYADSTASILNMVTSSIYSTMNSEDLARSSSVILDSYYPIDTAFVPTAAFYTSADGSDSDVIMITHIYDDGIMYISSRFISGDAYSVLTDTESYIYMLCDTMNTVILPVDGEFPEFSANIALPDGITVPKTDDAWLSETARTLAREMLENKCSPEYAELFTSNQVVIDICTELGSFDIENAEVVTVERFDDTLLAAEYYFNMDGEVSELVKRYIWPKLASAFTNSYASAYGTGYLAAQSIYTASDTFIAEADFICCNVILSCSGPHNIVISFSRYDDNIVNVVVHPVPAE